MKPFYIMRIYFKYFLAIVFKIEIDCFCKECGRKVHDFIAPDDVWNEIKPLIKNGNVLCYDCFCKKCIQINVFPVWKLNRVIEGVNKVPKVTREEYEQYINSPRAKSIKKIRELAEKHNWCKEKIYGKCMYPHCGCLSGENGPIDPVTGKEL